MTRGAVRSLDWMHAVRDSSDLVVKAEAVKYRREFGEDVHYVSPATVKNVAVAYGLFMDVNGEARVGVSTICQRFKLTPKTVRAAKLVIAQAGWWRVEPGGGAGNTDVVIAQIPHTATYYKSGDPVTAFWADLGYPAPKRGDQVPETGEPVAPKSVEEKTRLRGGDGSKDQLQGEGPLESEQGDEERAA